MFTYETVFIDIISDKNMMANHEVQMHDWLNLCCVAACSSFAT